MRKYKHEYLVSYAFDRGFGRVNVYRRKKINSIKDIEELEELIQKKQNIYVKIINYQLVRVRAK